MTPEKFRESLTQDTPPENLSLSLAALWWVAKGDWHEAHRCAQEDPSQPGSWVHAHLHRVEGDLANAGYWYRQAGKPVCTTSLDEECLALISALL